MSKNTDNVHFVDPKNRVYEYWRRREWDHKNALEGAKEIAEAKGKAEGKAELVLAMLKNGFSMKQVGEMTGLSLAEIEQLKG